jgi:hypothetical protein
MSNSNKVDVDLSEAFGKNQGLSVYNMPRPTFTNMNRTDTTILKLAEDAIMIALELRSQEGLLTDNINVPSATRGLIAALDGNFEN